MKLYYYKKTQDIVFATDKHSDYAYEEAEHFLERDGKESYKPSAIHQLLRLNSLKEVPQKWKESYIWQHGKEDLTAEDFFKRLKAKEEDASEYKEYLRLKKKYEP